MNHKEKLIEIYSQSSSISDIKNLSTENLEWVNTIAEKVYSQKGVFTVLVTLGIHKLLYPAQDIRYHQTGQPNGFSGRTIDTQFITPTLKELGLPSMAESGWLTRSLEQPYPYLLKYNGHISDKKAKAAFLNIVDLIQNKPHLTTSLLRLLFNKVIDGQLKNKIKIIPIKDADKLTIEKIILVIDNHFSFYYKTSGGSKLPVLAFYAIFIILINELKRYEHCVLGELGSHTASDRTSKTAGDIEIFKNKELFEAFEIKLNRLIDITTVRIAREKIIKYNPKRYYILTSQEVKRDDKSGIKQLLNEVKESHGCQVIINGILPTIKYYLRLINNLEQFIENYSKLISEDIEIKVIHKQKWNELIKEYLT